MAPFRVAVFFPSSEDADPRVGVRVTAPLTLKMRRAWEHLLRVNWRTLGGVVAALGLGVGLQRKPLAALSQLFSRWRGLIRFSAAVHCQDGCPRAGHET